MHGKSQKMKLYFLLIGLLIALNSNSQQIIRSTLSSFGSSMTKDGITLKQTIGQPSNTTTITSDFGTIRQGFQQPIDQKSIEQARKPINFSVYPNPAVSFTNLVVDEDIEDYTIIIERIDGGIISKHSNVSDKKRRIDLTLYPSSVYIIRILCGDRIGVKKVVVAR